jgi:1-acyl-sn-glycerol-3-phosphate acyltransferase
MESGAPVVPVAMFNTADIQPTGKVLPKIMRVKMIFGEPMYFPTPEKSNDPEELRKATDLLMKTLQEMSGQEYVDIYASQAKEALAEEKKRARKSDDEED